MKRKIKVQKEERKKQEKEEADKEYYRILKDFRVDILCS